MKLYLVMTAVGPAKSKEGPVALYSTANRARTYHKRLFGHPRYNAKVLEIETDDLKEAQGTCRL